MYLGKSENGEGHIFHLYVREKESKAEIWEGARSGTQAALDVFNADETGDISKLRDILPPILGGASLVYTNTVQEADNASTLSRVFFGSGKKTDSFSDLLEARKTRSLRPVINDLRFFKSESEIRNMRKAGLSAAIAHSEVMRRKWESEHQVDAYLEYCMKRNGPGSLAFEPVVAGGQNALSIHYVRNNDALREGDMVLVDGGATYGGYISDLTRCWPVKAKFSGPQRDLYQAVLNVQKSCVALCRESANVSLDKLHDIAEEGLKDQLKQLGFDMSGKGTVESLFPHHLGHYIGLDVHDTAGFSRNVVLKEGNCITVEPGVYVPVNDRWPKHFQGIGIRVEDSVCVWKEDVEVLTGAAVKEVEKIEELRRGG